MNEELHPASITKVMTLGLACEKAQGNWEDTKLIVSHEDVYSLAGTDSSHIALLEGEEVPLTDALYATQMASANDGANLLAEYFGGGTIADGVEKMNAKVKELGLAHTHFSNPHGISDEGMTIIMITHEPSIAACADKTYRILDGELRTQEEPDEKA